MPGRAAPDPSCEKGGRERAQKTFGAVLGYPSQDAHTFLNPQLLNAPTFIRLGGALPNPVVPSI